MKKVLIAEEGFKIPTKKAAPRDGFSHSIWKWDLSKPYLLTLLVEDLLDSIGLQIINRGFNTHLICDFNDIDFEHFR